MENIQYISIQQVIDSNRYPFTEGQIRHYLTQRHRNGLEKAVYRIGKRLYLRQDLFEEWIESKRTRG